jgi:hypothetical protein
MDEYSGLATSYVKYRVEVWKSPEMQHTQSKGYMQETAGLIPSLRFVFQFEAPKRYTNFTPEEKKEKKKTPFEQICIKRLQRPFHPIAFVGLNQADLDTIGMGCIQT